MHPCIVRYAPAALRGWQTHTRISGSRSHQSPVVSHPPPSAGQRAEPTAALLLRPYKAAIDPSDVTGRTHAQYAVRVST